MSESAEFPLPRHRKDELWQIACWPTGVIALLTFVWVFTFFKINLLTWMGWWQWLVILALIGGFSSRAPLLWARREEHVDDDEAVTPSVNIAGQEGSTYVVVEPPRLPGQRRRGVRPRDYEPSHWTLYSALVRGPLELGNVVLTYLWRFPLRPRRERAESTTDQTF